MFQVLPKYLEWGRGMLATISEGGTWVIPETQATYRFFHETKQIHLVDGEIDNYFHKNVATFKELGYQVLDRRGITPIVNHAKPFDVPNLNGTIIEGQARIKGFKL
jgi:hypothetical protein